MSTWIVVACNNDSKITRLLKSEKAYEVILGAFEAGESGNKKFVPLLLDNCADERSTTNIQFKGFTVYEEKMAALRKIYKKEPPVKISWKPDSTIIKFYIEYAKENIDK